MRKTIVKNSFKVCSFFPAKYWQGNLSIRLKYRLIVVQITSGKKVADFCHSDENWL